MSDDLEGLDMMLMQRFGSREATATVRGRRKAEKKSSTDKRRLRTTGRTAQLNLRCRPEFRDAIEKHANANGLLMIEVIEMAFESLMQGAQK